MNGTPDQAFRSVVEPMRLLELAEVPPTEIDPAALILTCANCGAQMDERKCKLICACGYFLSCSDYY
jgi:hypothetical protein